MAGFVARSRAYCHEDLYDGREVCEICSQDVGPVRRDPGVGIFNDSLEDGTARERVLRFLGGFRAKEIIPPVEVAIGQPNYGHRYKLKNGTHRFYCSLAAQFTHVPVRIA